MAQYNFQGNFENISERQLEFINKVVLEQDFKVKKVIFEPVGQAGDNYVANVKRIIVKGENRDVRMIAKFAPSDEARRQFVNATSLFNNEHVMYTEVLPRLVQLQKAADVPKEERLKFAKCYGSLKETPHEVIIFEDLKELNFTMLNKFESLTHESVKSALKNFAILHSLSFVLKKKEPETFDLLKGKLCDIWLAMDHVEGVIKIRQHLENELISVLNDDLRKDIVRNKVTGMIQQSTKLSNYEENNKYSVFLHGDAWTNNFMFKFDGDKFVQSIMIDYQVSKTASPVVDILYMIFNSTDIETRSKNFYDWMDYYHSELEKSLLIFDLKVKLVYPRDQLDADLKRYGKLLFGMCMFITSLIMRNSKEAGIVVEALANPDVNEAISMMNNNQLQDETIVRMKKRIVGVIDSFVEFGLL